MRGKIIVAAVAALLMTASGASAQSCSNEEALLACEHVSMESCRLSSSCVGDRTQGTTVQDVVEDTAAACCSRPEKRAKECVRRVSARLTLSLARAPAKVKSFLREARAGVAELNKNGCSTGTLGEL